mgnify:CR=1 FL=1
MRNYELTLVFGGGLKTEQLIQALEEIISFIQGKGGILLNQEIRGKRALLSPIKTQKEGNLAELKFTVDPSSVEDLEKRLKENPKILRFLCTILVSRKAKGKTPHLAPSIGSIPAAPKEPAEEETKMIDLGEIDKKLEEIFKKP